MNTYTSGIDLRLARTALRLQAQEVAARMGVPAARISQIENTARVTDRTAQRYREALATFETVSTPESAA